MGLHKLTAGDGYTYLTRQVAVQDATEKGHRSLGDYYAEHGESPGRWWGTGLTGLGLEAGSEVTETHMRNLFGAGRHPEAERLEAEARAAGRDAGAVARAGCLGRQFAVYAGAGHPLQVEVARRLVELQLPTRQAMERAGLDRHPGADPHRGDRSRCSATSTAGRRWTIENGPGFSLERAGSGRPRSLATT